jgi:hypothetical protein
MDIAKVDHRSNLALVGSGSGISEKAETVRSWQVYVVDDFFKLGRKSKFSRKESRSMSMVTNKTTETEYY